jgi:hypothetical protein
MLMSLTDHRDTQLPRATHDKFIIRIAAMRTHCYTTFGSAEEARLRCALHIFLGEFAHCMDCSREKLVRFSAHYIALPRQRQRDALLARWADAVIAP